MGKTLIDLEKVMQILNYYEYFDHCPTLEEIWKIYPKKISIIDFEAFIKKFHSHKLIGLTGKHYHILGRVCDVDLLKLKAENAKIKLRIAKSYQKIFSHIPGVVYVGLSGSVAAGYAYEGDDIDLFVICEQGQMYTARFFLLVALFLMGKLRTRSSQKNDDKFCCNMFFDENDLELPEKKRSRFGAFEIISLKTVYDKNHYLDRLKASNIWVGGHMPNSFVITENYQLIDLSSSCMKQESIMQNIRSYVFVFLENYLKRIQLFSIRKHQTKEIIADTQLWFHPRDLNEMVPKN